MTVKAVVFDFDGTVADTLDAVVNIVNRLSGEFGYKKASQKDIKKLRNLSSRQIIQYSGVPIIKLPFIVRRVKTELSNQITEINPVPGVREALIELKNQKNTLGIITSNSRKNVLAFLERNDLQELFDFSYSGTTLFGKDKVIRRFLKQENLDPREIVYVGDETRDIEAAKRTGIRVIAVSWGFNLRQVLAEHEPDFLIQHPSELITVIERLQASVD